MQFFLVNVVLSGGQRETTGLPKGFHPLSSVAMAPALPRPGWLTHKLSLFTCLLPLLQHCGHSLHYAKDVDKPDPSSLSTIAAQPFHILRQRRQKYRSKWFQCEVASCLMGPDSFLLSPLPSTVYRRHVFLQGYKLAAAAAAKINYVQKQEGREKEIDLIYFFLYPRKLPSQISLNRFGSHVYP